jgi:hypothetical protein
MEADIQEVLLKGEKKGGEYEGGNGKGNFGPIR